MQKQLDYEVILLTFSVGENINIDIANLKRELISSGILTRAIVITECSKISYPIGIELILTRSGSKLQKIKSMVIAENQFICIIDSDMRLNISECKELILNGLNKEDGISFGIIESDSDPGLLGECIKLDKRWSHRFLRPILHFLEVGITIPGQFVMYSPKLLSSINDNQDTFLDDLYFGLRCRQQGLAIRRVNKVVGYEKGRSGWISLFYQRVRWMKGLFQLTKDAWTSDSGWLYCFIHFLAYHGAPIILFLANLFLAINSKFLTLSILNIVIVVLFSCIARLINVNVIFYLIAFPVLHAIVTITAILPFSISNLRKR